MTNIYKILKTIIKGPIKIRTSSNIPGIGIKYKFQNIITAINKKIIIDDNAKYNVISGVCETDEIQFKIFTDESGDVIAANLKVTNKKLNHPDLIEMNPPFKKENQTFYTIKE